METVDPIRYCVMDNDDGPIAYCYTEENAQSIVDGLNRVNNIDPEKEMEEEGFNRFGYEALRELKEDKDLPATIMAQLAMGFL